MSNNSNSAIAKLSIDLGSLGNIEVTQIHDEVLEVFAKMSNSASMAGPTFDDDCVLNPPLCGPSPIEIEPELTY